MIQYFYRPQLLYPVILNYFRDHLAFFYRSTVELHRIPRCRTQCSSMSRRGSIARIQDAIRTDKPASVESNDWKGSEGISCVFSLTFGVKSPTVQGASIPFKAPAPFAKLINVPAKFGLKSIGVKFAPTVENPRNPMETMKNITIRMWLQPAYEAKMVKRPGKKEPVVETIRIYCDHSQYPSMIELVCIPILPRVQAIFRAFVTEVLPLAMQLSIKYPAKYDTSILTIHGSDVKIPMS